MVDTTTFFVTQFLRTDGGRVMHRAIRSSNHLVAGLAVFAVAASDIGSTREARAQFDENIQSRAAPYTPSLLSLNPAGQQISSDNTGACLSDADFVAILRDSGVLKLRPDLQSMDHDALVAYLKTAGRAEADTTLKEFFRSVGARERAVAAVHLYFTRPTTADARGGRRIKFGVLPIPYCKPQTSVKLSIPFNPTAESNALKSSKNNSPDTSLGFGGTLQVIAPGAREFDVVGFSAQSQSVRYSRNTSKSFDAVTLQGAYQVFLGASGLSSENKFIDNINKTTPKFDIPPANLITVHTLTWGFQNQTIYIPTFHAETVDLFTPQATLSWQNVSLRDPKANVCMVAIPDPRKDGFCYYADLSLTVGQTFSDVHSQQNVNIAASVSPGTRIPASDWKIAFGATATVRVYENVVGGRQDVLLQLGPTLTYSPPPFYVDAYLASITFALPMTYNQNFSTISTNAWHGFVIMPTLTIGFQPLLSKG
jgi:hypothetical protein